MGMKVPHQPLNPYTLLLKTNVRKAEWLWLIFAGKDRIFTPIVLNDDEQQLFADMKQRNSAAIRGA